MNTKFILMNVLGILRCCESIFSRCLCDTVDLVFLSNQVSMIKLYLKCLSEVILIEAEESKS